MNNSQAQFVQSPGNTPSQEDAILAVLEAHPLCWVAMPYLYAQSGSMAVHSRIASLRKKGYNITNKVDRATKPHASFYMLIPTIGGQRTELVPHEAVFDKEAWL